MGSEKTGFLRETKQDIVIECLYQVTCGLSFGIKIGDQ